LVTAAVVLAFPTLELVGWLRAKRKIAAHLAALRVELQPVAASYAMEFVEGRRAFERLSLTNEWPKARHALGLRGQIRGAARRRRRLRRADTVVSR
jgi:hypothetical protein